MMWLLRVLGIWSLLAAMVILTVDGTKSLASDGPWVFTTLGAQWFSLHAASLNTAQAAVERYVHPALWDPVTVTALQMPAWIFFTGFGILLYWLGRRRRPRSVYSN